MNHDLTVGKPSSVLWRFCIPLMASTVFQQLYNLADSFVAGKFISENALAAVGNSYEITLIYIAFAFGCNMGCSVVVSRHFGAKDMSRMKTAVTTSCIFSGIICLILMLLGLCGSGLLLEMIHTPKDLLSDSALYLNIYTLGLPFTFFYNISTGIFSALGDSRTPFIFLACSSTANIAVDILFVVKFGMGVDGVAWATFICQGVSCLLSLVVVWLRLKKFQVSSKPKLFDRRQLRDIVIIAVPSILQQSFISVGNIILQSLINGYGSAVMAGYSAGVKLNNLVITSFTTIGNGISNFTAQNTGAGKLSRIREGSRAGVKMIWIIALPMTVLYFFLGDVLLRIFLDDPTALALNTGIIYLKILAPFYFVVAVKLITDGILRGAGCMKQFTVTTFSDLILRVVLAFLFSSTALGSYGIWMAWPFGWTIGTSLSVWFYRKGPWRKA